MRTLTSRLTMIVVGLLLAWTLTGLFTIGVGNGSSFDCGIGHGTFQVRWGSIPKLHVVKDHFYRGCAVWLDEPFALNFGLPYINSRAGLTLVSLPLWLGIICAVVMGIVFRSVRQRAPVLKPTCSNCGYSLRGNRSGVCPECGEPITRNVC